jgi:Skp family chaperone for outer membrane proteins
MKFFKSKLFLASMLGIFLTTGVMMSQKVAALNSEVIRQYYPDAKQAEQRIQSFVDEWNRDLEVREQEINALEFEIKKNRLIWTATEKKEKEDKLKNMINSRDAFAREKFTAGGEYDKLVKNMLGPIEAKIKAAVNEVAADYKFDIIIDQSITPLPYINYKYDMTINVLRKLGVDTKSLEEELKEKIEKDPRNQQKKTKAPRGRGRTRETRRPDSPAASEQQEEVKQSSPTQEWPEGSDLTPEQKAKMEADLRAQDEKLRKIREEREKEQQKEEEEGNEEK